MQARTEWEHLSREVQKDRRKGKRVPLAFPIEVSGFDHTGHLFCEHTTTSNISEAGCCFRLNTRLGRGDVVAIKLLSREDGCAPASKPVLYQIAWSVREGDGWRAGASKLQSEDIWHVAFPGSDQKQPSSE